MNRQSAFILLQNATAPNIGTLMEALCQRYPGIEVQELAFSPPNLPPNASIWFMRCAGMTVSIRLNREPAPHDEPVVFRASRQWPQAREVYKRHTATLYVTTVERIEDQFALARLMTAFVGTLIAAMPNCLAVVWNSQVMRSAAACLKASAYAFAPSALWIDFVTYGDPKTGAVIATAGLAAFVGREVEFEVGTLDQQGAVNLVFGLVEHLIGRGSAVPDGHTFGSDETERLKVRHQNSTRLGGMPVMLVRSVA